MKKLLTLAFLCCICGMGMAQNSSTLIVFSEGGMPFDLILNGVKQNHEPQTNIRVESLKQPYYNVTINFKEKTIEPLQKKHLMVQDVDGNHAEATYIIKQDKKGRFKLKFYSAIPIESAPPAPEDVVAVEYTSTPRTTTTVTVTETTTTMEDDSDYVDVDVNVGGVGMDVDINVDGSGMDVEMDVDMGVNMDVDVDMQGGMDTDIEINEHGSTTTVKTTTTTTIIEEEMVEPAPVRSTGVCSDYHMSSYDFDSAKETISSKVHESDKLEIAQRISTSNCLKSEQVRDIMKIFVHESTRLEFAEFAYKRVFDKGNYFMVNEAFKFDSSVEDLNDALGL